MPYGYKIELNGADVTDKVSSFEITASLDSYVRELSLDLADPSLFDSSDFANLEAVPSIEVFTRIATDWISQGQFFAEKPTFSVAIQEHITGIWGRSITALLGSPWADKINKTWTDQNSFYGLASELCAACGLTWDPAYSEIDDFVIYGGTFSAEDAYPIDVLNNLAEFAGAVITTDRLGHVCVRVKNYSPGSPDETVDDVETVSVSSPIDFPDFGNRIKVSASGTTAGYRVELTIPNPCLPPSSLRKTAAFARVTDENGFPVNGLPVSWSSDPGWVTFDLAASNTGQVLIGPEEKRATDFYTFETDFEPSSILGVFAKKDTGNYENLAAAGYTLDGNTVTLVDPLTYCDQAIRVYYVSQGVATNLIGGGGTAGTDTIIADVSGSNDKEDVYVANACECPMSLSMYAAPSSIYVQEASQIVVYAEVEGDAAPPGTTVFMTEPLTPKRGVLGWTRAFLGWVDIALEATYAINQFEGICQCETQITPSEVSGVWLRGEDDDGNAIATGGNLYAGTFNGKTIDLNEYLYDGMELLVSYRAKGAALNTFEGVVAGSAMLTAWVDHNKEEPLQASVTITVQALESEDSASEEDPAGCCEATCDPTPAGNTRLYLDLQGTGTGFRSGETVHSLSGSGGGKVATMGTKDSSYFIEVKDQTGDAFAEGDLIEGTTTWSAGIVTKVEDTESTVKSEPITCKGQEVCCIDGTTMKRGCWQPSRCIEGTEKGGAGGSGGTKEPAKPSDTKGLCKTGSGKSEKLIKCTDEQRCCTKFGIRDCYPKDDCKNPDQSQCFTDNCMRTTGTEKTLCQAGRFNRGLSEGGDGCKCSALCADEYNNFGTTQSFDGGSYRTVKEIAQYAYGLSPGTAAYNEKVGELHEAAIDQCLKECGQCKDVDPLTVSGPQQVTKPGGYQYVASGGLQPYEWSVSGSGASISSGGYVTLSSSACGSYTVSVADACGKTAETGARITNSGKWSIVDHEWDCAWATRECELCGSTTVTDEGSSQVRCGGCEIIKCDEYKCTRFFIPVPYEDSKCCGFEGCARYVWVC